LSARFGFFLRAAIAYNLKKYMKFKVKKVNVQVVELPLPLKNSGNVLVNSFFHVIERVKFRSKFFSQKGNIA
jgi:hypothetical protein